MKQLGKRFSMLLTIGIFIVMTSGCITVNLGETPSAPVTDLPVQPTNIVETATPLQQKPVLTEETLMNMQYLSPMLQTAVQLENGAFDGEVNGVELHAQIQSGIQFGDLNADGVIDAAFLMAENTGGSGVFVSLIVIFSQGEQFQQAPAVMIDDRPVINEIQIVDARVSISGKVHGPNDPMVDPTTSIRAEYRLFGDRIIETRLTSAFSGSSEHSIQIDSPVEGEEVSSSILLSGSMPIGPFENTLNLTIQDQDGNQLLQTGFMVQAADMGAPASFSAAVDLPLLAPGTELLVLLSELSMADGSPMAIDSVMIKVK